VATGACATDSLFDPMTLRRFGSSRRIDGEGIEGDGEVGLWATNTEASVTSEAEVHLIFAVNGMATQFSDWGADAPQQFSGDDDGAAEAKACAGA
jgi:hypothetical protein